MLNNKLKLVITVLLTAVICLICSAGLISCAGGDTDGGKAGDETFQGTQFVPNDENSGSISLEVKDEELGVSDTAGFIVHVVDSAGVDVPGVTISCDSEKGVAIIEPTTGSEITDSGGRISGRIGCESPGSYLFGCRVPVGGNIRKFTTIRCSGPTPAGFTGFSGSAGGGLGTGGADNDGDAGLGGTDTDGIRITAITVNDTGAADTTGFQVDTTQGVCTADDPSTVASELVVEPFGDTFADVTIVNNTSSDVRFTSLKYSIPSIGTSRSIAFIGEALITADGGQGTLNSLVFSVVGSGDKNLIKNGGSSNVAIPSTTGVRNVKFTLFGTTGQGEAVQVSGSVAISFTNYNHCSGS